MNIMFLLIGVSLLAAMTFLFLFIWAVRNGQYDDMYTPSVRILFDDAEPINEDRSGKEENRANPTEDANRLMTNENNLQVS